MTKSANLLLKSQITEFGCVSVQRTEINFNLMPLVMIARYPPAEGCTS